MGRLTTGEEPNGGEARCFGCCLWLWRRWWVKGSRVGSLTRNSSKKLSERQPDVIYDEAKVPPYTLPDPLVCLDGTKVTTPELWRQKRRPEILELFRTHMYGRAPIGKPSEMTFEVFDLDRNALDGKATRKQVRILFTGKPDGPSMDLLIYLPNDVKRPVPVFLLLNFFGNHAIHPDPAIRIKPVWFKGEQVTPPEESRGRDRSVPVEKIIARGYGVATAYYGDIAPDFPEVSSTAFSPPLTACSVRSVHLTHGERSALGLGA